jgi:xanthine dehydrogenase small subunit
VLDGQVLEVGEIAPTTTVLEYLRDHLGRTGTKEGCAEGDCGACTVVLGELDAAGKGIHYRAVNSCIRFLHSIDGHELVTVESLQTSTELHPVQQAMVDHHASQCGFCTPGFVMSLFALYLNDEAPQREAVVDSLAGNLCRCTGYRPIIAAGCAMNAGPPPTKWSREDAQSTSRVEQLQQLKREQALSMPGFTAPQSVTELAQLFQAHPDSLLLAGGTDIGLWVTKQLRQLPAIVYLGEVAELQRLTVDDAGIEIGAAVSLTDAWRCIVKHYPQLHELAQRFASPPVCNSGTLVGNVANGSPVGDSMPVLIALGAQLELRCGASRRRLPLEQLYMGYRRKDLRPGEFIVSVHVPLPRVDVRVASYKISKRFDQDIAAVCAAFAVHMQGERIVAARVAFGGMAAVPSRALKVEAAFVGKRWNEATLAAAVAALADDFQPLSDLRASNDYRMRTAQQLLRRFCSEHHDAPTLRLHDVMALPL